MTDAIRTRQSLRHKTDVVLTLGGTWRVKILCYTILYYTVFYYKIQYNTLLYSTNLTKFRHRLAAPRSERICASERGCRRRCSQQVLEYTVLPKHVEAH